MRAHEFRDLREIRLAVKRGDRAGAISKLDAMLATRRRSVEDAENQLCLAVVLSLPFRCERLNVEAMPVRDCLTLRTRVWPSGGGKGSPAPAATACIGCPVGLSFAVRLPSFRPPPSTIAAEVLAPSQRLAKRARALAGLGTDEPVSLDPLTVAAGMSPDDPNDWRG